MTKLLSDRVKKIPATQVSADRYSFLKLSEAEPDLGVPASNGYVLASQTDGTRSWVSALSTVIAPGSDGQIIYNNGGSLGGTTDITFDDANNDLKFADNAKAVFGAGSDLQIYHDGTHSYINDAGTGELRIQANGALDINKYTGENMARFFADGAVELYFDNSKKFETTSAGASVTGNLVVSGDLTISGTTTTVNTTNLDVEDAVITLNTGQATPLNDIGLLFQRYSTATSTDYNVGIVWDEGSDRLVFGKTPEDGADNDLTFSAEWMTINSNGGLALFNSGVTLKGLYNSSFYVGGDFRVQGDVWINRTDSIKWDAAGWPSSNSTDLVLTRDAANTLALRNSTNSQTFHIYNTYTDASNYERGFIKFVSNEFRIGTESLGTGSDRKTYITNFYGFLGSGLNVNNQSLDNVGYTLYHESNTSANIIVRTRSSDTAVRNFSITGQAPFASATTNIDGGDVLISGGTPVSTGAYGNVILSAAGGNVGIGTASPVSKLHVDGDFAFASDGSGANWLKWQRLASNNWRLTSDGVGHVMQLAGNLLTIPQDVTIQRGGLNIERSFLSAAPALDITETWNDAGTTFTAIQTNITDTASDAASLLMDLRVGGSSKFSVDKNGVVSGQNGSSAAPTFAFGTTGVYSRLPILRLNFAINGHDSGVEIGPSIFALGHTSAISWTTGTLPNSAPELTLVRDAANTLAQRNGTNAQAFNLYNTYTDASNYERAYLKWDSNVFTIGADDALGTGTARTAQLISNGGAWNGTLAVKFPGYDTGLVLWGNDDVGIRNTGTLGFSVQKVGGQVFLTAANSLAFGNNTALSVDVGVSRESAGILKITDGTTGNGKLSLGNNILGSENSSTSSTTQTAIASFAAATYGSGKFVVQAKDTITGEVHVSELLVVHDGTTAYATEYGTIHTGANPLATYEVDINTGNVRILATAASANSTTYKVTENLITA